MTVQAQEQDFEAGQAEAGIRAFAQGMRAAAERPEGFWMGQRRAIARGIEGAGRASSLRLAWAGSLALMLLATGLLTQAPPPRSPVANHDPDHDLLVGVERAVRRPVPQALEPARLLALEMERSLEQKGEVKPQ